MKPAAMALLALSLVLAACRIAETEAQVSAAIPSPDGSNVAYLYRLEPPGGALSDFHYYVSVLPRNSSGRPWEEGEIIWRAKEIGPLYVFWTGESSLEVLLEPGLALKASIRTPSKTFAVSTRQLRSTLKAEIAGEGSPILTKP